eukprot:scaffold36118_cov61-Phaeocystis_antarctica.AAC.5
MPCPLRSARVGPLPGPPSSLPVAARLLHHCCPFRPIYIPLGDPSSPSGQPCPPKPSLVPPGQP